MQAKKRREKKKRESKSEYVRVCVIVHVCANI